MASTGNDRARHVLIVVENLPVPFDRRVWNEAKALRDAGYQVSIICPTGAGAEERELELDGIRIYRHPLPEASSRSAYFIEYACALFWEFRLAWRVWGRQRIDVIHACNPPDLIFLIGAFFKLFFGTKFVFDQHDICPELFEAKFGGGGVFHAILRLLEWLSFRTADISIATNESYRAIAIERGGMTPDRVFVVRSGPNIERIKISPPVPALKKGRRFLVGYVGVMGKQEGVSYLLEAINVIVNKRGRHDVHFTLAGGGPEVESLKRLANDLGVTDFVDFTGRIPDAELLAVLNTADVCVNPDQYNVMNDKSTMNKIMEYMALAKPIVQFDLTEGRFSAQDASLYALRNDAEDFAEKILELLEDAGRRQRMGQFGYDRVVNELAWSHEAPKLVTAYENLFMQSHEYAGSRGKTRALPAQAPASGPKR